MSAFSTVVIRNRTIRNRSDFYTRSGSIESTVNTVLRRVNTMTDDINFLHEEVGTINIIVPQNMIREVDQLMRSVREDSLFWAFDWCGKQYQYYMPHGIHAIKILSEPLYQKMKRAHYTHGHYQAPFDSRLDHIIKSGGSLSNDEYLENGLGIDIQYQTKESAKGGNKIIAKSEIMVGVQVYYDVIKAAEHQHPGNIQEQNHGIRALAAGLIGACTYVGKSIQTDKSIHHSYSPTQEEYIGQPPFAVMEFMNIIAHKIVAHNIDTNDFISTEHANQIRQDIMNDRSLGNIRMAGQSLYLSGEGLDIDMMKRFFDDAKEDYAEKYLWVDHGPQADRAWYLRDRMVDAPVTAIAGAVPMDEEVENVD